MILAYASHPAFQPLPGTDQYQRPPPPHFHVLMNDGREAWVRIDTQEIIHDKIASREIAEVLAWAKANREKLAVTFEELQL
jgi:hypothetical protein